MRLNFIVSALFLLLSSTALAFNRVGNGGGAWTCRNISGTEILWIVPIDLYEATSQYKLNLTDYKGSYKNIVRKVSRRLLSLPGNPFPGLDLYLDNVDNLRPGPQITYLDTPLKVINDALYFAVPDSASCAGGIIRYEQIVNYDNHGFIFVQKGLFENLTERAKAAMVLHEAIYAYRRAQGDTDSLNSRRIVGLAFSDTNPQEFAWHMGFLNKNMAYIYPPSYNFYVKFVQGDGTFVPLWNIPISLTGAFSPDTNMPVTLRTRSNSQGFGFIAVQVNGRYRVAAPNISIRLNDGNTYSAPLNPNGWAKRLSPTLFGTDPKYSCETMSFVGSNDIHIICVEAIQD